MSESVVQFELGEKALHLAMHGQAGTEGKALSELTTNALDAGSSEVHILVTSKGFEVKDNGVGFQSEKEVDDWFAKVAFSHNGGKFEREGYIGKHGLGRLQICVFSAAKWRTNTFEMRTDSKNRGFAFQFEENLPQQDGCTVYGDWYNPLSHNEVKRTTQMLSNQFGHARFPVFVNGKQINTPLQGIPDIDTENFMFWRSKEKEATLVNVHEFVRTYPDLPSGTIVSKKAMLLNTARTNPLEGECEVWDDIAMTLKKLKYDDIISTLKEGKRPSKKDSIELIRAIRSKRINYRLLSNLAVIPTVIGGVISPNDLVARELPVVISFATSPSKALKESHKAGEIVCLNLSGLIDALSNVWREDDQYHLLADRFLAAFDLNIAFEINNDTIEPAIREEKENQNLEILPIDANSLPKRQACAFNEVVAAYDAIFDHVSEIIPREIVPAKNIDAVFGGTLTAVTDGSEVIYVDPAKFAAYGAGATASLSSFGAAVSNLLLLSCSSINMTEWIENNEQLGLRDSFVFEDSDYELFFTVMNSAVDCFGSIIELHFMSYLSRLEKVGLRLSKKESNIKACLEDYQVALEFFK